MEIGCTYAADQGSTHSSHQKTSIALTYSQHIESKARHTSQTNTGTDARSAPSDYIIARYTTFLVDFHISTYTTAGGTAHQLSKGLIVARSAVGGKGTITAKTSLVTNVTELL